MAYRPPQQSRSRTSEDEMLAAFQSSLEKHGYLETNLEQVAAEAGLSRPGFLKRFGSKKGALIILYNRYCDECVDVLKSIRDEVSDYTNLTDFFSMLYQRTEEAQLANFAVNRAMSQDFFAELSVAEGTVEVFKAFLEVMNELQKQDYVPQAVTPAGQYAASQLIITIGLNSALGAMTGLPRDKSERVALVGHLAKEAFLFSPETATAD